METIQIVLGKDLRRAADRAARLRAINRSALVREALREHLKRLATTERERLDREGYANRPIGRDEFAPWDKVATWPDT